MIVVAFNRLADAYTAAAFDDGVEDGAALASLGFTDEEPVLLADRGGADGVFEPVVVDLQSAVGQEDGLADASVSARGADSDRPICAKDCSPIQFAWGYP